MKDMTVFEAHYHCENIQRIMTEYRCLFGEIAIIANGKAIEALEKQIPKKPRIKIHETTDYSTDCKCPTCGACLAGSESYCRECGQRLDWENRK